MTPTAVIVSTTVGSEAAALTLGRALVDARLAACVQVSAITSLYRWQGAREETREWLCQIKSTADRLEQLMARIRELHPYDVPEILAVPVMAADPPYLQWLSDSVRAS